MKISDSKAEAGFLQLLAHVERGERFVITRHGSPIAELLPVSQPDKAAVAKTLDSIRRQRALYASRGITLSELIGPDKKLRDVMHENYH